MLPVMRKVIIPILVCLLVVLAYGVWYLCVPKVVLVTTTLEMGRYPLASTFFHRIIPLTLSDDEVSDYFRNHKASLVIYTPARAFFAQALPDIAVPVVAFGVDPGRVKQPFDVIIGRDDELKRKTAAGGQDCLTLSLDMEEGVMKYPETMSQTDSEQLRRDVIKSGAKRVYAPNPGSLRGVLSSLEGVECVVDEGSFGDFTPFPVVAFLRTDIAPFIPSLLKAGKGTGEIIQPTYSLIATEKH